MRAGLSRSRLLAAAAEIADRDGPGAISLARLAARFGVRPPSLYKHVDGLDSLLGALAVKGMVEINARLQQATVGRTREAALAALAAAYWRFAREHPGVYSASLRPPAPGDREAASAADALLGTVNGVLSGYGLAGDDLLHASRGLRAIVHGFVALDAAGGFRLGRDLDETLKRLLDGFVGDLSRRPAGVTRAPAPAR